MIWRGKIQAAIYRELPNEADKLIGTAVLGRRDPLPCHLYLVHHCRWQIIRRLERRRAFALIGVLSVLVVVLFFMWR